MPETVELTAAPDSAAEARRFVRASAKLDSMRYTESDLLVTEMVGNLLGHADVEKFELSVDPNHQSGVRVAVSHDFPGPLDDVAHGVGFTLLERVARNWGHDFLDGKLEVWFTLRAPGAVAQTGSLDDAQLVSGMSVDPALHGEELVRRHKDLALAIARRYRGKGLGDDDLEQVAMMALLKAIQRFDSDLGDLRPYAAATISGEMKKFLRDRGWSVRVPRSIQESSLRVAKASDELSQKLGHAPSVQDLASNLDMSEDEITEALLARFAYASKSLDKPSTTTGITPMERMKDDGDSDLDPADRIVLREAIGRLPERQQWIMDLRFSEDMTQSEIADVVGISQMHVSRLLADALAKVKSWLEAEESTSI